MLSHLLNDPLKEDVDTLVVRMCEGVEGSAGTAEKTVQSRPVPTEKKNETLLPRQNRSFDNPPVMNKQGNDKSKENW